MKKFFWILSVILVISVMIVLANTGTEEDPLVSKSYIDQILMPEIQNMIESGGNGNNSSGITASVPDEVLDAFRFKVISVEDGKTFIGDAGCEFILRMGSGTVIATQKGGISDTTAGFDIQNGENLPSNHLLIIPLEDGRGFKATSDVLIMVKGAYTIYQQ